MTTRNIYLYKFRLIYKSQDFIHHKSIVCSMKFLGKSISRLSINIVSIVLLSFTTKINTQIKQ